jgi:hypothetical protein
VKRFAESGYIPSPLSHLCLNEKAKDGRSEHRTRRFSAITADIHTVRPRSSQCDSVLRPFVRHESNQESNQRRKEDVRLRLCPTEDAKINIGARTELLRFLPNSRPQRGFQGTTEEQRE